MNALNWLDWLGWLFVIIASPACIQVSIANLSRREK